MSVMTASVYMRARSIARVVQPEVPHRQLGVLDARERFAIDARKEPLVAVDVVLVGLPPEVARVGLDAVVSAVHSSGCGCGFAARRYSVSIVDVALYSPPRSANGVGIRPVAQRVVIDHDVGQHALGSAWFCTVCWVSTRPTRSNAPISNSSMGRIAASASSRTPRSLRAR